MTETIKRLDNYISNSKTILETNNTLLIKEQIIKIRCELGFDCDLDNEYDIFLVNYHMYNKDKQILISLINRMKNDYVKLVDEYNKQQNDYKLEKQRNRLTIICSIIGAISIVVSAVITFILNNFLR